MEYEPSSKGNKIKALKSIVNDFIDSNYIRVSDIDEKDGYKGITTKQLDRVRFVTSKLKKPNGTTTKVILTEKEISTLFDLDLKNNPTLQKTRDIFLIGCYTGLRHSDYNAIKKDNIKGDWLKIIVHKGKTGKTVNIPIRSELQFLFEKYDYKIPTMSSQKVGQYVKDVCQYAGIDENIEVISNAGGIESRTWTPKYKLISSHTARRSGLTLMYDTGIKLSDLLLISGHTTEKQLKTYIFINDEDWQNRIIESDFIKKSHLKVV
jgi:integrase